MFGLFRLRFSQVWTVEETCMGVSAVRVLPMGVEAFADASAAARYFLVDLSCGGTDAVEVPGRYWYRASGLCAPSGSLVIFQWRGDFVAQATLDRSERLESPHRDADGALWHGFLQFVPESVAWFEPVVSPAEFGSVWPGRRVGNAKHRLDTAPLDLWLRLVDGRSSGRGCRSDGAG